jgi:hypothetical protein
MQRRIESRTITHDGTELRLDLLLKIEPLTALHRSIGLDLLEIQRIL